MLSLQIFDIYEKFELLLPNLGNFNYVIVNLMYILYVKLCYGSNANTWPV